MMTEEQAYPDGSSYAQRAATEYTPGQAVMVGPAYQSGGMYANDGHEGRYWVVRPLNQGDWYLARHPEEVATGDWCLICFAARMRPV